MLGPADRLPRRPHRVLVCGLSGSGTSDLAPELAGILGAPYTDIDGLFHGPDWTPRPQFVDEVDALIAGEDWVTEWRHRVVRERLLDRADLLVWLDYPFRTTFPRLLRRTVRRRVRREVLWHGNVEPPLRTVVTDPDDSAVRWAIADREKYRERMPAVEAGHPQLAVVRLGSPREARRWLRALVRGEIAPR